MTLSLKCFLHRKSKSFTVAQSIPCLGKAYLRYYVPLTYHQHISIWNESADLICWHFSARYVLPHTLRIDIWKKKWRNLQFPPPYKSLYTNPKHRKYINMPSGCTVGEMLISSFFSDLCNCIFVFLVLFVFDLFLDFNRVVIAAGLTFCTRIFNDTFLLCISWYINWYKCYNARQMPSGVSACSDMCWLFHMQIDYK